MLSVHNNSQNAIDRADSVRFAGNQSRAPHVLDKLPVVNTTKKPMDDLFLYEQPGHLFRRLHQIAVAIFLQETEQFSVTPIQFGVLLTLLRQPRIDQGTLADLLALDTSSTSEVVKRLVAKGLVHQQTRVTDRRSKVLTATPAAERLADSMQGSAAQAQNRMLEPLSENEKKTFVRMMQKLAVGNNDHSRAPLRRPSAAARSSQRKRKTIKS